MRTRDKLRLLPSSPARVAPAAIEDIAVLPVFYRLEGKKVVVAGGTAAAAWKADLLAAAGARVHIYAETLDDEFLALLEGERSASFVHHAQPWSKDAFCHAAIAICDAETIGEAQAFYCAVRASGVPVNIIDRPDFCEFQFGSIVNRSPVIVSISTNGAAPILGQAIRQRIEALLPPSLKDWAVHAAKIRRKVNACLSPGQQRRRFWEKFSDAALTRGLDDNASWKFADPVYFGKKNSGSAGKVTLVGAGPGDAELLTLKAMRALQAADVILFDDLVSDEVLELARREAKRMQVGKRGGRVSCKQEDINDLMVKLAKSGKNVVRLKAGDPAIFGRAGEEIAVLERYGIPVSIVPGITAASAMAAELGVSLTHRDHAQSVRLVTGHAKNGKLPDHIDWQAIADPTTSTVFYMGGQTALQIQGKLEESGLCRNTPVVICSSVSRENNRRWNGTISTMDAGISKIGFKQPVLIGIGEVFRNAQGRHRQPLINTPMLPDETEKFA